jgi:hypothetical protein
MSIGYIIIIFIFSKIFPFKGTNREEASEIQKLLPGLYNKV